MATTKITNTSGVTRFFGFIPPHGVSLAPGGNVTVDGDLRSVLAAQRGSRIKLEELNRMETERLIAILQNPEDDTPNPTITLIAPATGTVLGGTAVAITGTGFAPDATVTFDGVAATNIVVVSTTSITCVAPEHVPDEAVDVVVTNGDGGTVTSVGGYTYDYSIPTIALISPNSGPDAGGTAITITGTNFSSDVTVDIDGNPATSVVRVSSTQLTCVSPAGTGVVDVVVTCGDEIATEVGGFTYTG